jgi:hypothetical protein
VRKTFWLLVAVMSLGFPALAQTTTTSVRVQIVIVEPGGKAGAKKVDFSKQAKPGPGKELKILISSDRKCTISPAAFTKDGQLLYGVPEIVQLPDDKTAELPLNSKWTWDGHEGLEEIDVIVAEPGAADYKPYEELVKKMGQSGISDDVRRLQAGAMRRWIDQRLKSPATAADYSIKNLPTEVGGMVRGEPTGQEIAVPAKRSTVIRLRISQ